ncbi:reverse transcriptase family protein [Rhizobium ruizarguesonis]
MAIGSLTQLSLASGIPSSVISSLVFEREGRYRKHFIAKRDGGARTISVPLPALLQVQKTINKEILSTVDIHDAAVGFRKHHSIIDHVKPHLGNKKFAKFDIKDCFGSIAFNAVFSIYLRITNDPALANSLSELSTDEGKLPQGAATSPSLCNISLKFLDERIFGLCQRLGLTYTRYADDLLISGTKLDLYIYRTLKSYIEDCGFLTNEKSRLMEDPQRLIICGISISESDLKLPKQKKRDIRQAAHFLVNRPIVSESISDELFDPFHVDRVLGRLQFWRFVEPEAEFPIKYIPIIKERIASQIDTQ